MRCSRCEHLLDQFADGSLGARETRLVGDHLRACTSCSALLREVRVVDALLETAPQPALAENFTFALMAEVRALPSPRSREHPVWSFLVLYVAAAWVAAVLGLFFSGVPPQRALAALAAGLANAGTIAAGLSTAGAHALSHTPPSLAALGVSIVFVELALAAAAAAIYFVVRPRIAARLARQREVI